MNKIHVIGIGFRPLGRRAGEVVCGSDVVLASGRLHDVFRQYEEYEYVKDKIIVHGSVYETLDYIGDNYKGKKISLLAAGDPMFFGIGRLVVERFGREEVEVYPDLSSVQVAFSKVKETSNNALFVSLHGGPDLAKRRRLEYEITELPSLLERHEKLAVLTDRTNSPEAIARVLQGKEHLTGIKMYVCEKLGYDEEKISEGAPDKIANMSFEHPNVVIVKRAEGRKSGRAEGCRGNSRIARAASSGPVFGLRESDIRHTKGLITKDEVRAVTIHKLGLPREGVFWDIGAGSGSVSLEAARICPGLDVYAVEKDEKQIENLRENREALAADNVRVVEGEAPGILETLPPPDRVFAGGTGGRLKEIIKSAGAIMRHGIIVINAATIETLNEAVEGLEKEGFEVEVSEVSVSRTKDLNGRKHLNALNPIFIIRGQREGNS